LNTKNSNPVSEQLEQLEQSEYALPRPVQEKKPFVEPEVSVPVDVLEATSFFQASTVSTGNDPTPTPTPV
jgi:hypothetical protein